MAKDVVTGEAVEVDDIEYRLHPAWTISQEGASLTVHGGADARYLIELASAKPSRFASLGRHERVRRRELGREDEQVLEQLVTAEIVVPVLAAGKVLRVAMLGDASGFTLPARTGMRVVASGKPHDLAVIVRATSTYAALLAALDYENLTTPHLLIDLAFHHTISIGPLVFPGETACIACLRGRVESRWDDDAPPPEPRALAEYAGFAGELAATEVAKIAGGETSLANATVSWDLDARTVVRDRLLKVPLCPVCIRTRMDHDGGIALPWGVR